MAYLTVKVHLAALDTGSKQCASAYVKNGSRLSQTIRLNEASNANAIANFKLRHIRYSFLPWMTDYPLLDLAPQRIFVTRASPRL